jgi:ribonuclease P protein component
MAELFKIERLKSRPQFLAAAKGVSEARGAVVVQRLDRGDGDPVVRLGFTATRKVGNAVVRNRAKRRLRAAASQVLPLLGRPCHDYVLVARGTTVARPFPALLSDITTALKAAHRKLDAKAGDRERGDGHA